MKRIHFDNMNNWMWIVILILSLIFILAGGFEIFEFENPKLNKRISAVGFFIQFIYLSRIFWYKNYVQWNKKGAVIKINSFMGKSLRFDQVKITELKDKKLIITKDYGSKVTFNLNGIAEADTQKLNDIISNNAVMTKPAL